LLIIWKSGISVCSSAPLATGTKLHAGEGISACVVTPLGHLVAPVELVSAVASTSKRVRISFDRAMLLDAKLTSLANYSIVPKFYTGAPISIVELDPQGIAEPTYVDLVVTEMTDGETYIAEVQALIGPIDTEGVPLAAATNSVEFFGSGVDPTIDSLKATGLNGVEVIFSEAMYDNVTIRDITRYSFDNGLNVLSISDVIGDTVTLVTDDQVPGLLYTLTITQP